MIYHDRCSVSFVEELDDLDEGPARTYDYPGTVFCEVTPYDSDPPSDSGPLKTRYTFFTAVDIVGVAKAKKVEWDNRPVNVIVTYRGATLSPEAGFEVHKVNGRPHHTEAILEDFYQVGV